MRRLIVMAMFSSVVAIGWEGVGAVFSAFTATAVNSWTSAELDTYLPSSVTATRTAATTCLVTWSPHGSPPPGTTYDVTDGSGATAATGVSGTSRSITVVAASVTPTVRTRLLLWTSPSDVAASPACTGWPSAPVVGLAASTGQLTATWPAPTDNGSAITGYTATTTPASTTCALPAGTRTCTFTGLTDGLDYTVSVTATSAAGTGPAGTAVGTPYPSAVMTTARLRLWLDGADAATLFQADACSSPATAGQPLGCWRDKSGQDNHAVQPTAANRATLTTVNSRTAPQFDGSNDSGSLSASLLPNGSAASTTIAVASLTDADPTATGFRTVLSWGTDNTLQARWLGKVGNAATVSFDTRYSGSSTPGAWPLGLPAVVTAQAASAQTRTAIAGADLGAATSAAFATGTTSASVGRNVGGGSYWNGPIPEVIVFTGTLTSAEHRAIQDYLARKWGVTLVPRAPAAPQVTVPNAVGTNATVTWSAPTWDGGSAVTGYTATATPTSGAPVTCTATPPATSCSLSGLLGSGVRYDVTVVATNAAGAGPASTPATFHAGIPAAAGAKLWLAADDLDGDGLAEGSGESVVIGGEVATWADKSGNAFDTTIGASQRPNYGQTINGLGVATFDGTDRLSGSGSYGVTGDRSLFTVVRERSVASDPAGNTGAGTYVIDRPTDTNGVFSVKVCGNLWALQVRNDVSTGGSSTCTSSAVAPAVGRVDVLGAFRSGTSNSIWVSGTPGATGTYAGTVTQAPITLGRQGLTAAAGQDLDIAEVLLYDSYLSVADRRAVETYLATKWGGGLAPHVPTGVSVVGGDAGVAVSWTAPTDTGTSSVTGYTVTSSPGGFTCTTAATSCTVTGLTNGTSYTFTVRATNATGTGAPSAVSGAVTPNVVPGAPTSLVAADGDTTSSLTWTAPAANGGTAITSYTATAVPADGTFATRTCTVASTSCPLAGLTNGITYTVTVTATNGAGAGPASASTTTVPRPAILASATNKLWLDAQHAASLNSSAGCGGAQVSSGSAVLCWKDRSASGWNAVRGSTSAVLTANVINGRQALRFVKTNPDYYNITSAGIGAVGSADRTVISVVTARTTIGTLGTNSSGFVAGWTVWNSGILAKAFGGTTTVDHLQADGYNSGTTAMAAYQPSTSPALAAGIFSSAGGTLTTGIAVNGRGVPTTSSVAGSWYSYGNSFRVGSAGTNAGTDYAYPLDGDVGEVLVFDRALTEVERRGVEDYLARRWGLNLTPQAPTGVALTPGTSSLGVSWTAPAWNGGFAITDYVVQYRPSGGTWTTFADGTSTGTTATITGLTTATTYEVRILAVNSLGAGAASTAVSATFTAWSPAMLGATVAFWVDADAAATLTTPAGVISAWADQSGNSRTASQATAANRPAWTNAAMGGRYAATFDGTNDSLSFTGSFIANTNYTVALAASRTSSRATNFYLGGTGGSPNDNLHVGWDNSTGFTHRQNFNDYNMTIPTYTGESAEVHVFTQNSSTGKQTWRNGTLLGSSANTSALSSWAGSAIGLKGNTGNDFHGRVGEIVMTTSTLSVADREALEGHLAWKWGTQASLDPAHTYVAAAPIVGVTTATSPLYPAAVAGVDTATVSWLPPAWNGGATVTGYTVTPSGTGSCVWSSGTSASCTGLTDASAYTFGIRAATSLGAGAVATTPSVNP